MSVVRVILNIPAKGGIFDYAVPSSLEGTLVPGQMAVVPFNHGVYQAVILRTNVSTDRTELAEIISIVDPLPVLTEAQLRLAEKIAERSLSPLSDCVNLLLTEKIRKLSAPTIRLPENMETAQSALFESADTASEILSYLREKGEPVEETALAHVFKGSDFRSVLNKLIRSGKVIREQRFEIPVEKPKRSRFVIRTGSSEKIPGTAPTVLERRKEILAALEKADGELPVSALSALAKSGDLAAMEKAGIITIQEREVFRDHRFFMQEPAQPPFTLNAEQENAVNSITADLSRPSKPVLLHGVTGSGKTEVYLRAAAEAIRQGKQVLMLLPEISLTPQILARFTERFPGLVGLYHSGLSSGERFDTWRRGRSGEYRVIIGPRSAFAVPMPELGLILVDECHEDSYYQTNMRPYFSAIRAAADYAEITGSRLVFGSATPTTAQMYKAQRSGWSIARMTRRATGVKPPVIRLVDMRDELKSGNSGIFSRPLLREIQNGLDAGKQSILFMNRRGTASYTFCHTCGHDLRCPNCDIPYTYHAERDQLVCHYCGKREPMPTVCPVCGSDRIHQFGAGSEKIEQLVSEAFPTARVLRIDADSTNGAGKHEALLSRFARHEADILVGTQMIAKGLDFPDVRLVGILLADVGSNFSDYRVDEHAFQMLTQVAGRAGRAKEPGLAILQTYQPNRYSIRAAIAGDYDAFYAKELEYRRTMGYPPFCRMVRILTQDTENERAEQQIRALAAAVRRNIRARDLQTLRLIGPAPCYFARLNGRYRWHLIIRGADPIAALNGIDFGNCAIEVDPPSLL